MNRSERHGKLEKLKGHVKQSVGAATGNEKLEREGVAQRAGGAIEEGLGTARRKVGDLVAGVDRAIEKK
jgi:uncharacterized protein YjbJ (UPF0337 family)